MQSLIRTATAVVIIACALIGPAHAAEPAQTSLLNVSYDPTREFYAEYNALFARYWHAKTGQAVTVNQSHGGSGAQARAVIEGLDADVVTLALGYDIDAIAQRTSALPRDWQRRLPEQSSPYTSTIVLVVRKGNPKKIHDWNDAIRPGIAVVTANPKTSGGARWTFLAAYAYALKRNHNDDARAANFVAALYKNVAALDSGARGSTSTFVERGQGDVLLAWENEAYFILRTDPGAYEIVVPSVSIVAQPPVTWIDANTQRHGTTAVAQAYLRYLYSAPAQQLACTYGYRPTLPSALRTCRTHFGRTDFVTIANFGGWTGAQARFFADGGVFDRIAGDR